MKNTHSFDLSDIFEATIFGIFDLFRCYFVTLFLLLFHPRKYRELVVEHLQADENRRQGLSRPFTFVLVSWLLVNIYAPPLAQLGRGIRIQYLLPVLGDALKVDRLVIYCMAPLIVLCMVYGFFRVIFLLSGVRATFYDALTLIAYPFGFALLIVVPYPDIRELIPSLVAAVHWPYSLSTLLNGLVALCPCLVLFARVYQTAGDMQPNRRRMLKWTLIITSGVLWSAAAIIVYLGWGSRV